MLDKPLAHCIFPFLTCVLLAAGARDASAFELDTLLPADIPGYGGPPVISVLDRPHPDYAPIGIELGNFSLDPVVAASAGYDSSPNGASASSSEFSLNPSITALNADMGFGAYASGTVTNYPDASSQNLSGYTLGLGEHVVLPRETANLAIAIASAQETSFSLNTVALPKPVNVTVKNIQGSDAVICGMATFTPAFSVTNTLFGADRSQNRTDFRQSLTGDFSPGGPARFVTLLHATESAYLSRTFNSSTYSALAGVADEATGIWKIRFLAGAAARQPVTGTSMVAPVLEASLSWVPGDLDSLTIDLAREIDDPDQESAAGYTLSEANLSIAHEYLANVIFTGSFNYSRAAYFNSTRLEMLYSANAAIQWHLNRALALNASYAFNDRQANFLRAANQHVFILGMAWSP